MRPRAPALFLNLAIFSTCWFGPGHSPSVLVAGGVSRKQLRWESYEFADVVNGFRASIEEDGWDQVQQVYEKVSGLGGVGNV